MLFMMGERVSQSVSDQSGRLGLGVTVGGGSFIVIGMWLEAVEGREASELCTIGRRRGFAHARSMSEGWALPTSRNLVYCSGGLRRVKPASTAFSK